MALLFVGLGIVLLFAFSLGRNAIHVAALRRRGLYPKPGQATMADVRQLVRLRKSVLAMRCYREIHPKVSMKEARNVVDQLALRETAN